MAKSKIIKEIANKEISLQVAFNRLLIIASDIENNELIEWATNELNGYPNNEQIPQYRKCGFGMMIYSGINGGFQVTNQPLPFTVIDKEVRETLEVNYFNQDIATIERYAFEDNGNIGMDLTSLAGNVYKNTGIRCIKISMNFPKEIFLGIVSAITTKLLTVFIELDKEFGCLDDLDIETNGKQLDELNDKIKLIIYEDNSLNIGDKNKVKDSFFQRLREKKE